MNVEYVVEIELAVDIDNDDELVTLAECLGEFELDIIGIAEEAGPISGDPLFFIQGKERKIIEMFRDFAECTQEEIEDIMEIAHAVH